MMLYRNIVIFHDDSIDYEIDIMWLHYLIMFFRQWPIELDIYSCSEHHMLDGTYGWLFSLCMI